MKSYAKIADSPAATRAVVRQSAWIPPPHSSPDKMRATAPTDTVLVDIIVNDPSAVRARDVANSVAAASSRRWSATWNGPLPASVRR